MNGSIREYVGTSAHLWPGGLDNPKAAIGAPHIRIGFGGWNQSMDEIGTVSPKRRAGGRA